MMDNMMDNDFYDDPDLLHERTFDAIVIESSPGMWVLGTEKNKDNNFRRGQFWVSSRKDSIKALDIQGNSVSSHEIPTGATVRISFRGLVRESSPAQIHDAFLIQIVAPPDPNYEFPTYIIEELQRIEQHRLNHKPKPKIVIPNDVYDLLEKANPKAQIAIGYNVENGSQSIHIYVPAED